MAREININGPFTGKLISGEKPQINTPCILTKNSPFFPMW